MAHRYDNSTTTFNPEGRLLQVEYAIEAINTAGSCIGIVSSEGIVLAAEKKALSKLLAPSRTSEKIYKLDNHVACVVAGLTSDANILIDEIRQYAQQYFYTYQEPIPIYQLVAHVCNYKQAYTQYGGLRPFGVSFLFAGWDAHQGFQLYQSDPSGNFTGWKATCMGANNGSGKSLLKTDFTPDLNLDQALGLTTKVLLKTLDGTTPTADRVEFFTLTREGGEVVHRTLPESVTGRYLEEAVRQAEELEQKEKANAERL